jgi:hypothetical protein
MCSNRRTPGSAVNRSRLAAVVLAGLASVVLGGPGEALAQAPLGGPKLRVCDATLRAWLEEAQDRSATLAALVNEIEASDLVVHVTLDPRPTRLDLQGGTRLVGEAGPFRTVSVMLGRAGGRKAMLTLLAHELQHVVEIARAVDVRTQADLAGLYQRIGSRAGSWNRYETAEARRVQARVRAELGRGDRGVERTMALARRER